MSDEGHQRPLVEPEVERAEAIAMGVDQVAGYHRSQRPDDDVSGLPVVITGEVKDVQDLLGPLATTLGRPIQIFNSDLDVPDGFDPAEYAANLGLFLAARSKGSAKVIAARGPQSRWHRSPAWHLPRVHLVGGSRLSRANQLR